MWRRLWSQTVWADGAIPEDEECDKYDLRVLLPMLDVTLMVGGIIGALGTMPSLDKLFPGFVGDVVAIVLAVCAFACLVGVSFPRLTKLEVRANGVLLTIIGTYALALIILAFDNVGDRAFVASLAIAACYFPASRLIKLGRRLRKAEIAKAGGG